MEPRPALADPPSSPPGPTPPAAHRGAGCKVLAHVKRPDALVAQQPHQPVQLSIQHALHRRAGVGEESGRMRWGLVAPGCMVPQRCAPRAQGSLSSVVSRAARPQHSVHCCKPAGQLQRFAAAAPSPPRHSTPSPPTPSQHSPAQSSGCTAPPRACCPPALPAPHPAPGARARRKSRGSACNRQVYTGTQELGSSLAQGKPLPLPLPAPSCSHFPIQTRANIWLPALPRPSHSQA